MAHLGYMGPVAPLLVALVAATSTSTVPKASAVLKASAVPQDVTRTKTSTAPIFIKGDLTHIGTRELVSRFDHVGVRIGPHIIGNEIFAGVTPSMAWYADPWAFALHVPLNLLLLETGGREFGGAKIRSQDWDEVSDFARLIRFITYGRKESEFYFTVTNLRPTTLGHGQLVHNYQPNIDVDRSMTGLVLEAFNSWAGFQLQLNDITFNNSVVGGLVFVKPFAFVDWLPLETLSFGVEYAADFQAPRCIQLEEGDSTCLRGSGHQAGFDPLTGASRDNTFVRTDPDLGRPLVETTSVQAFGLSGEFKFVRTERTDFKLYGTIHQFADHGRGLTGGLLGRFNSVGPWISAFRVRAEGRTFDADYLPAYFDTLYEITKYQSIQDVPTHQVAPTRYQRVFGDPENGFVLTDTRRRFGFNTELSWALFNGSRSNKKVAIGLGLSDSTGPDDTNFYAHIELPILKYIQVFGSLLRVNAAGPGDLFDFDSDNLVVLSGARVQILPFLFVNAHYSRAFQIIRSPGLEFHLGNSTVVDEAGQPSALFATDQIYDNVQTLFVELEIGLEFKD